MYGRTYQVLFDAGINEKLADELPTQRTLAAALRSREQPFLGFPHGSVELNNSGRWANRALALPEVTSRKTAFVRAVFAFRRPGMPTKSSLRLVKPATQKRAVGPLRRPNSELRRREHLTETEVEKLIVAAKANRHGHRDVTMVLVAYRHGLRASEICNLRWDQIDFTSATLHVHRVKNGKPSTHPVRGDELRALRKLHREAPKSPFVFMAERPIASTGW